MLYWVLVIILGIAIGRWLIRQDDNKQKLDRQLKVERAANSGARERSEERAEAQRLHPDALIYHDSMGRLVIKPKSEHSSADA